MKKILLSTLLATTLYANGWNTATAVSSGALQYNQSSPVEWKIEQFFLHSNVPNLYFKIGYYKENIGRFNFTFDGAPLFLDTSDDLLLGAGYNIFTFKNFFLDLGASLAYRINTNHNNPLRYDTAFGANFQYTSTYEPFSGYLDVGLGYSAGSFTLRMDVSTTTGSASTERIDIAVSGDPFPYLLEVTQFISVHTNLSIAYWW